MPFRSVPEEKSEQLPRSTMTRVAGSSRRLLKNAVSSPHIANDSAFFSRGTSADTVRLDDSDMRPYYIRTSQQPDGATRTLSAGSASIIRRSTS